MKNYLFLAMILIAGMTAYPQATRSARESKNEKSSAKKETQRSVSRSESNSNRSATVQKSKSEPVKSSATRSRVETRSQDRSPVTRSATPATRSQVESRSSNPTQATRSRVESRSSNPTQATRSRVESRSSTPSQATRSQVESRSTERNQATRSSNEVNRKSQEAVRVQSNPTRRDDSGTTERRGQTTVTRPENKSGSARTVRESGNADERNFKVNSSSASRIYREGRGTLTRDDGKVIRHQNDDVFKSNKFRLDYDNYENLRRSDDFRRHYRDYDNWYHHRNIRIVNHYHNRYIPIPYEIRRTRYYYRHPVHIDLIWTPLLFHRFMYYYPTHNNWEMEFGSTIETISAYEAQEYAGTVRRVYGKVDEVYYSPEDENYILYIGSPFPYQDLSVVIPRHIANNLSRSPKWYFEDEFVWVVGLINVWEGKPEIIVRDEDQIRKY